MTLEACQCAGENCSSLITCALAELDVASWLGAMASTVRNSRIRAYNLETGIITTKAGTTHGYAGARLSSRALLADHSAPVCHCVSLFGARTGSLRRWRVATPGAA